MFPCDPASTLMHRGLERAADRFGDRDAVRMGDERWSFGDLDGLANAFARHLVAQGRRPRRPGGGDDVEPGRVRRRRPRHQQARRGRRAAEPGLEGGRGRPRPRAHRPRPRRRRRPGGRAARRAPGRRRASPTSTTPPTLDAASPATGPAAPAPPTVADDRRGDPRVQLGHDRAAQGGAPHPPLDRPRHRALVRGARPRARRPLPGGHAPVAHPRPAQPARRGRGRRHRAAAPPVRPRRGAAPHRDRPHHPRDGGRPHRPGDGQPPRPRGATTSRRSATSCGAPRR